MLPLKRLKARPLVNVIQTMAASVPPASRMGELFLSLENMTRLGSTIESFMYDTYKIQLRDVFDIKDFEKVLRDVMIKVDTTDSSSRIPITEKNKLAIVMVRNTIFEHIKSISSPHPNKVPDEQKTEHPVPQHRQEDPLMPMPVPIDRISSKTEDNDEVFFKRLQELEHRRNVSVTTMPQQQPIPPTQPTPPTPTPTPSLHQPIFEQQAPAPQSQQQVIVAVPPPPRRGSTVVISSWDRNLLENIERTSMVWTGQLPTSIDLMGTRVTGVFLPIPVYGSTPYIVLVIEGAGGNQATCILSPDALAISGRTRGWMLWSPLNDSLSYIRNVPSPWTVHLRAADGTSLPLGIDHLYISSIAVEITNRTASLVLSSVLQQPSQPSQPSQPASINDSDFQIGDQVWIITRNSVVKTDVLSVSKNGIDVRYKNTIKSTSMSNAAHEWMNCRVLNYTRQWSLVIDITSTEHTRKP